MAETLPEIRRTPVEQLTDIVSDGVALDVFGARMCAELLEELDSHVEQINTKKIGMAFFGNQQLILNHHMLLLIWRLFEPHTSDSSNRTIPAALGLIRASGSALPIQDRARALEFARSLPSAEHLSDSIDDDQLRDSWLKAATDRLPRPQETAKRDLSRALHKIQKVRHQALAHRADVGASLLIVPAWSTLRDLIETAEALMTAIADAFLTVSYSISTDVRRPVVSLRRLMAAAGIVPEDQGE